MKNETEWADESLEKLHEKIKNTVREERVLVGSKEAVVKKLYELYPIKVKPIDAVEPPEFHVTDEKMLFENQIDNLTTINSFHTVKYGLVYFFRTSRVKEAKQVEPADTIDLKESFDPKLVISFEAVRVEIIL